MGEARTAAPRGTSAPRRSSGPRRTSTGWWRRPRTWAFQIAAAVATALVLVGLAAAGIATDQLDQSRRSALDRFFPIGDTSPAITVVEIDEASVERYGWPWDRTVHAELVEILAGSGARVVGYDVIFDLPAEGDELLAAAMADAGNVVLGSTGQLVPAPADDLLRVSEPRSEPVADLAAAARGIGLTTVVNESDGVVRSVPAIVEVDTGRVSSGGEPLLAFRAGLATAMVGHVLGVDPDAPRLHPDGVIYDQTLFEAPASRRRLVDLNFSAALRWRNPARPAVSALDVLDGSAPEGAFDGALVLVGATDPLLKDFQRTPTASGGGGDPGVYVHANALNSLLLQLYRPPIDDALTLATVAVLALAVTLLSLRLRVWLVPVFVLGAVGANYGWTAWRFAERSATDLVYPTLAAAAAGVIAVALRYVTELRERRRVAALFGQYVPPAVAQQLIDSGRAQAAADGERVEVTVFFCDLRGFTRTAADLTPVQVRELLNRYYEHVTAAILAHGGTVMQYVGDEVFGVFGAPVRHDDHAQRALDCAVEVRDGVFDLADRLEAAGLPPVAYGIGLNSGPVVAAHVGSFHKQYAVIGDTVNVGSRFCTLSKAHQISLPGQVRERLAHEPELLPVGPVAMKGVDRPSDVYRVGRTSPHTPPEALSTKALEPDAPKAVELPPA